MGIGELFGVKSAKLVLKGDYPTIEDLYEKIKDEPFEAGTPFVVTRGVAPVIAFPQLDRNNQVQLLKGFGSNNYSLWLTVTPAGIENIVINEALEKVTFGFSGLSAVFGRTKKRCMELVVITGDHINGMGL